MPWTVTEFGHFLGGFLQDLSEQDRKEALAVIQRLETHGTALRRPHSAAVDKGLFELRTDGGVRIFYTFRPGRRAVLIGAMLKKRGDIPTPTLRLMRQRARAAP